MPTYIDRVQKSVTLYEPGPLPENVDDLGIYLVTELKRLGSILYNQATFRLERIHEEPQRPRIGDYQCVMCMCVWRLHVQARLLC